MTKPRLKLVSNTERPVLKQSRAPKGLSRSAKAEWARLEPLLRSKGTLTAENEPLLRVYASNVGLLADLDRELADAAMIIEVNGIPRPHPLIGARNRAAATAIQLAKRLGILGNGSTPKGGGKADGDAYSDLGI